MKPSPFTTAMLAAFPFPAPAKPIPQPISDGASDLLEFIREFGEQCVKDEREDDDRAYVTLLPKIERIVEREDALRQQMYEALVDVEAWLKATPEGYECVPPDCVARVRAAIAASEA